MQICALISKCLRVAKSLLHLRGRRGSSMGKHSLCLEVEEALHRRVENAAVIIKYEQVVEDVEIIEDEKWLKIKKWLKMSK